MGSITLIATALSDETVVQVVDRRLTKTGILYDEGREIMGWEIVTAVVTFRSSGGGGSVPGALRSSAGPLTCAAAG